MTMNRNLSRYLAANLILLISDKPSLRHTICSNYITIKQYTHLRKEAFKLGEREREKENLCEVFSFSFSLFKMNKKIKKSSNSLNDDEKQ